MKSKVYYRSLEKSITTEDIVRDNIVDVLERFDRIKLGEVVVRLTRIKGRDLFRFPKFLCEVVLSFGHKKIVVKKKSEDLNRSIVETRFALEKTLRRALKKEINKRKKAQPILA